MYIITPETFKARKRTSLIMIATFLIVFFFLCTIPAYSPFTHLNTGIFCLYFIPSLLCVAYYFALHKTEIIITQNEIRYNLLFKKYAIRWDDIYESKIVSDWHTNTNHVSWLFITKEGKTIPVQMLSFSKKDKQKLAETLIKRCPNCHISDMVRRFADNDFPWYHF